MTLEKAAVKAVMDELGCVSDSGSGSGSTAWCEAHSARFVDGVCYAAQVAAEAAVKPVLRHAERLAAALALVLYDAHPVFGSTAKWRGGVGGRMITSHCSLTQGTPPGDEWAEHDLPSKPLREFLAEHPVDLDAVKAAVKAELQVAIK